MLSICIQQQPYTVSPTVIGSDFGVDVVTCGVKMMSSCHGWGWQPPQTASLIHIRHIESVWTHWFAVHLHTYGSRVSCCGLGVILVIAIVAKQGMCFLHIVSRHFFFYSSIHISYLLFLGNCPTSHMFIRHIESVWAQSYVVHRNTAAAFTYTVYPQFNRLRFWCTWSIVESKWFHYVIFEADSHLKLLPTCLLDIYKVFEHIDMLSICIQ